MTMRNRQGVIVLTICIFFLGLAGISGADDAEVLPEGVWSAGISHQYYLPVDKRFDPDGDVEDAAVDFNGDLNSNVFPTLGVFENPPFNLPTASIGASVVSFEYDFDITEFSLAYGITDKLSVGINIPYWWVKNEVDARLDTTNATVGKNPLHGTPLDPFGGAAPLIPIALGGTPLDEEDVQRLLGSGLDVNGDGTIDITGFAYERFETWDDDGIGDIEAGAKYQYLKTDNWRLAFTGGVKIPTGEVDDPDNLVDYGRGSGAWALLFYFNNDYTAIKNMVLNGTLKYKLYLPDKETLRVPDDVNQPITINEEKVDRDIGDVVELEVSGKYEFSKGANVSLLYKYGHAFKDDISGNRGFAYSSLEDETDWTEHVYIIGLSYSTVPLYMEKKFPLPVTASIAYRNRFAGSNNVFKSQYIAFGLQIFF